MSANGMRRNQQGADGPKDRTQLVKYAIFYLVRSCHRGSIYRGGTHLGRREP
jgi:hypothetical protein